MKQITNEETHKDIFWDVFNLDHILKTIPQEISNKISE
jgi:hypothetical protein